MTHKQITLLRSGLFRRRACISMLSPQHPFSPGSCVGPLRCGKILHAPGRPWPLSYGRQKLRVFVCVRTHVCARERATETKGQKDERRNRRCMCFCDSTDNVILQMTFPLTSMRIIFLFIAASTVWLPLPVQRLGALFRTIIIFVHCVLFPFTFRPLRNTQLWSLSISL